MKNIYIVKSKAPYHVLFLIAWLFTSQCYASRRYVDAVSGNDNNDGTLWGAAYKTLTKALEAAAADPTIDAIDVAAGTYYPTGDASGTDRNVAFFILRGGLTIRGGLQVGSGVVDPAANPTILSGDIGIPNDASDNSFHVMVVAGLAADAAPLVIEGFTFTKGNANGSGVPQFNGVDVNRDYGGGIYARQVLNNVSDAFVIRKCRFIANNADYGGAGIFIHTATPSLENIVSSENTGQHGGGIYSLHAAPYIKNSYLTGNNMTGNGGGILSVDSNPKLTGCLITGNKAGIGGGVYNYNASPTITNCTIAGNTAGDGGSIYNTFNSNETLVNTIVFGNNQGLFHSSSTTTASYSLIQGDNNTANGNLDGSTVNPSFVNALSGTSAPTTGGDYHLVYASLSRNAGNNAALPSPWPQDANGDARIQENIIDMGGFEQSYPCQFTKLYVDISTTTAGAGWSWARPLKTLREAMDRAEGCGGIDTIVVAAGTYYPTGDNNRDATYKIQRGITILGGYPAGGGLRNPGANPTVLSGNIGDLATDSDNSYHIFALNPFFSGIITIDGFTITGGRADGTGSSGGYSRQSGGAISLVSGSAPVVIKNCIFNQNYAAQNGGAVSILGSSPTFTNCRFTKNSSRNGGAIFTQGTSPLFVNCYLQGNSAINGGAISSLNNGAPTFVNCLITGNASTAYGGGVHAQSGASTQIINTVIASNYSGWGGGLAIFNGASPVIQNSIVYGNFDVSNDDGIALAGGGLQDVKNSLVQGRDNAAGNNLPGNTNPNFVDLPSPSSTPTTTGDFHVQVNSPVVNRGNNAFVPVGITTDLDGNQRIQASNTDMGAYEQPFICPAGNTLFVDASTTMVGNGDSWSAPFVTLSDALTAAASCTSIERILVAKGTYYPIGGQTGTNRSAILAIPRAGLRIIGGFPTGGGARAVSSNPTILSGDIGTLGAASDNCYHVLAIAGIPTGGDSVVVDGFIISGGHADGSGSDLISGQNIAQNVGGGIVIAANNGVSNIALTQLRIIGNDASEGGGLYIGQSAPVLVGNLIAGNRGGAVRSSNASPVFINNTIAGNSAADGAGAKLSGNSTLTFKNTVIAGNANGISKDGTSTVTMFHSLVQGETGGSDGNIDGATNPMFEAPVAFTSAPVTNGNYSPALGSPVINAGDNAAFPVSITLDLAGQARIQDGIVDLGAFEQSNVCFAKTLYVDHSMSASGDGASWTTAYKTLGEALTKADACKNVTTVLVAQGTYYPPGDKNGTDIDATFGIFRGGLKLLGGYPAGGGPRNPASNKTILSGEMGSAFAYDNSRHIMIIAGLEAGADSVVVDGFEIIWGNAAGFGPLTVHGQSINQESGGGIYMTNNNQSAKIAIRQSRLFGNSGKGGGFYIEQSAPVLIGNDIFANSGGAILATGSDVMLVNNTIAGNNASNGAVDISSNTTLNVYNTIISNNKAGISNDNTSTFSIWNSLVQGETGTANGNIDGSTDPKFTSPFSYQIAPNDRGDYSITAASPVIDKGDNSKFPNFLTTALDGNARVQNGTIDMGGYEAEPVCTSTVRYVDANIGTSGNGSDWSRAYKTLDEALAVLGTCPDINTILVAAGTYYPGGSQASTNRDATFAISRGNIKIEGGYPVGGGLRNITANVTILSGDIGTETDAQDNVHHVVVIAGLDAAADSVVLEGFTITRGNANGSDSYTVNSQNIPRNYGGGINAYSNANSGKIRISNCKFIENNATEAGGAIGSSNSAATVRDNIYTGNSAKFGGGVYNTLAAMTIMGSTFESNSGTSGGAVYNATSLSKIAGNTFNQNTANSGGAVYTTQQPGAEITGNTFIENHAMEQGGAIASFSSPTIMRSNTFTANKGDVFGGAIYTSGSSPIISSSTFRSNQGPSGGAIANMNNASPKIINSVFQGNIGEFGGAIFNWNATPVIASALLSGNKATSFGGAIYNQTASPLIINVTIGGNFASVGGAIYNSNTSAPTIANSIIKGNNSGVSNDGSSQPVMHFSLVQNLNGETNGNLDGATNPLFVNAQDPANTPSLLGDYRVADASPVINAGFNDLVPNYLNHDLDSMARIGTLRVDFGAYEHNCPIVLSTDDDVVKRYLHDGQNLIFDACTLLAKISPAGTVPVSGIISVRGQVSTSIISHATARYVRRHYEITPDDNADNATAEVTLYFSASDFQHYNTQFGNSADAILPVNDGDNVTTLKVMQYHGTGNANGDPASYASQDIITPTSVIFNHEIQLWEVNFPVNGFSGFFISGQSGNPLPVTLIFLNAQKQENDVKLKWQTSEETASARFEIQRSTDARSFDTVGEVKASGESNVIQQYVFNDINAVTTVAAHLYYRLKMIDLDGSFAFSKLVTVSLANVSENLTIYPNPLVQDKKLTILIPGAQYIRANLLDIGGHDLKSIEGGGGKVEFTLEQLPPGTYLLRITADEQTFTRKVVVQ